MKVCTKLNLQPIAPTFYAVTDDRILCTGFLHFKSGTFGQYGPIIAFHIYKGQDKDRHSHYDGLTGDLPLPKNLNSFNSILGARNAIDASTRLINLIVAKKNWDDTVRNFLSDEVFALDEKVQPGNSEVDPDYLSDNVLPSQQDTVETCEKSDKHALADEDNNTLRDQLSYSQGIMRKLALLESGTAGTEATKYTANRRFGVLSHARDCFHCSWLQSMLIHLNVVTYLGLVIVMVVSGFVLLWPRL